MERRTFLQGMGSVLLSSMVPVDMVSRMMFKHCSSSAGLAPDSMQFDCSFVPSAQITVVGIGPLGANVARSLATNAAFITCLPIVFDPADGKAEELSTVLTTVKQSDLLFICSGFVDQHCVWMWEMVAATASETSVLTVGVIPIDDTDCLPGCRQVPKITKSITTLFQVSALSLQGCLPNFSHSQPADVLTGQAMCHLVASITDLINKPGMIGIDFHDICMILKSGQSAHLGVGLASGSGRGRYATEMALERLHRQQVSLRNAKGVMVNITACSSMTMDDYDDVSQVIHRQCPPDASIIIGLLSDEALNGSIRVAVMPIA